MNFQKKLEYTGKEVRPGKNSPYTLATVMLENGKTQDFLYKGEKELNKLEKRKMYNVDFNVKWYKNRPNIAITNIE